MAKTEVKTATNGAAKTETTKVKKVVVKRSSEELKKSQKGRINLAIRVAMAAANLADRAGLPSIDKKDKEGSKQLAGKMNGLLRDNGKIDNMDEKSENYIKLKDLATKALPELQKKPAVWGANGKAFLNFCIDTLSTEKGPRIVNSSVLEGMVI